jgi:hypothetical protein
MPTSSKRIASQRQQQSVRQDDGYDEYVYYPYHPKSVPGGGGYEYVQDPQQSQERQQSTQEYYDEPAPNNSASMQRT